MRADYDIMCRINESIDMNKRTAQFLHSAKNHWSIYGWKHQTVNDMNSHFSLLNKANRIVRIRYSV